MGILSKILEKNNLTPYSYELPMVLDKIINEINLVISTQQSELKELKNDKKQLLNLSKTENSENEKLLIINDDILKLKRSIFTLNDEINEIQNIKNIIDYQSKLSGVKKEIGKLNLNDGSDLMTKLKNKN